MSVAASAEVPTTEKGQQLEQEAKRSSSAFGRVWTWIKEHHEAIIITTVSVVAAAAIITGLTFLTIAFPEVMVPIYIGAGVLAAGVTACVFGFFAAFGALGH